MGTLTTAPSSFDAPYGQTEKEFWEVVGEKNSRDGSSSGRATVYKAAIDAIRRVSLQESLSVEKYAERLEHGRKVIDEIQHALTANLNHPPKVGQFWELPNPVLVGRQDAWRGSSPIDPDRLESAAVEYLSLPWLQCNWIEWNLLNGFIFDALSRLIGDVHSGAATGRFNWAYALANGRRGKTLAYRLLFASIAFTLRWLLFPLAIFLLYHRNLNQLIPWIAVPYGSYILFYLAGFRSRLEQQQQEARKTDKLADTAELLVHAYGTANAAAFSPTRLLEQIKAAEGNMTLMKPIAHSVLQRAIARDPSLFTV